MLVMFMAPIASIDHAICHLRNLLEVLLGLIRAHEVASHKLNRSELASLHSILHLCKSSLLKLEAIAIRHGEQVRRSGILLQGNHVGLDREQRLILGLLRCSAHALCDEARGQRQPEKLHGEWDLMSNRKAVMFRVKRGRE